MSNQNVQDIYPLSPAQQSMLLYLLLAGYRSEVYFDQYVATMGPVDPAALRTAWQRIVDRHTTLRTLFVWEKRDQPLQVVRRQVAVPWHEQDWRAFSETERRERLAAFLKEDHALGFDLGKAPLLRVSLLRWADDEWRMVWSFSHLILDGWSMAVVLGELPAHYSAALAGKEDDLPPARPFREYIGWLKRQDPVRAEEHWRSALIGFLPPTPIPFDGTGGEAKSDWKVGEAERILPPEVMRSLQALARRHQITLNTIFQGLWGLLLGRWGALDDVLYGVMVSGRPYELDGVESMAGMFVTGLPLRLRLDPNADLIPWLKRIQEEQFEQREFEYCSMERILIWSGMPRNVPLFDSMLVYENYPSDPLGAPSGSLGLRDGALKEAANFALTLYVSPREEGMSLRFCHHWERFSSAAAERLAAGLETLALALLEEPGSRLGDLSLLRREERRQLVAVAAGPVVTPPLVPVHRAFQQQAARTPGATALESGERKLSYADLDRASRRLAARLRGRGVVAESIIGLCAERSPEMLIGMLAILEAGGAYLPLDPAYPPERLAYMLDDSGARMVLTQERLLDRLPVDGVEALLLDGAGDFNEAPPHSESEDVELARLAYVIYTSGSTGRPKGVLVPHSALAHYVDSAITAFEIGPSDRVLQFASISFDTSAEEIFPCLTHGGTLVLRDDEMVASLDRFVREVGARGVTALDLPTAYWHELVAEMESQRLEMPAALRLVILGGEQARRDRLNAWFDRVGERIRLVNTYGPTETTIVATRRELTGNAAAGFEGEVPIGRPIERARIYVAGLGQELIPAGLEGELLIGGAGVTRGYLGRPELTAERFVPDPYSGEPGARLYRTGDLARLLPGSDLQFRGRTDHQVKVRGYRVELGEIEAGLRALPVVRDAAVMARDERLIAWVVPSEREPTVGELRAALQAALPDYMVPAFFVFLADLPLTPSGKVDRRALARLEIVEEGRASLGIDFTAPRNPIEEMLVEIWSDLLGREKVGIHDDFFQLGGHSLLVAKLASRVRQAFQVELPMIEVFKKPTIADMAQAVEQAEREHEVPELPPIRRAPRDRPIPLSFPQERVWFLDQLSKGGNIAYNFQMTLWLRGILDFPALQDSLTEMVRRHEIFRTTFPAVDGQPVQRIHPLSGVRLPVVDLRALSEEVRQKVSEQLVHEATQRAFDVTRLPLVRWTLLRLQDDLHELVQVEHHFVHDGWSLAVFLRELQALYGAFHAGLPSPLPELPVQFADFAAWQRAWMSGEVMERHLEYWRKRLEGCPPVLDLPTDHSRPRIASFVGELIRVALPAELYDGLRRMSRQQGFTLYMTMLAGFNVLLHRYTGQLDIPVGAGVANRRLREAELLIGMIVNTMVLRNDLSGDPVFRELLQRVREVSLTAYAHQDMPFERLVEKLQPERDPSRNPLFQVMFSFHDSAVPDFDFPGLEAAFLVRHNRSAKTDLNVIVVPRAEQRVGQASAGDKALLIWEYRADLFERSTMERMVGHYFSILAAAAAEPGRRVSELPLLSAAEREEILAGWNETRREYPREAGLAELFEQQVERSPEAIAVVYGEDRIPYVELNRRANWLAARLRALGVGCGALVGLCTERSVAMVEGMVGILKAGGAYVPLDPSYPDERLALMLEDLRQAQGRPPVVVTAGTIPPIVLASGLPVVDALLSGWTAAEAENPSPVAAAADLAYVIYTSGSTGRPKGVAVPQRAVARLVLGTDYVDLGPEDRIAQASNASFDAATFEIWGALLHGGCAIGVPREVTLTPAAFAEVLRREQITALFLTTALFNQLAREAPGAFGTLRHVLVGGEAVDPRAMADVLRHRPPARLLHVYGPTENTTFTSWERVREVPPGAVTVPIGRPIANTRVHVLDAYLQPVPAGVYGELYVGGDGLAHGYVNRPELTAERFVPDPFGELAAEPGGRLYRTGDLVRYLSDGRIEFLGRNDFQVKIRGFRIELGEVEAAVAEHPAVREVVAVAREDRPGERRLVVYVVPARDEDGADLPAALRGYLERKVPSHMVPSAFVVLEALPLNPNGKLDRRALPVPEEARDEAAFVAPRTPVEETVAGIWREVLGIDRVGVRDDFFVLGGHSLSAARVLSRVRDALGVNLSLVVIFETPTVEGMAAAVSELAAVASEPLEPSPVLVPDEALLATAAELSDADLDALLGQMMTEGEPA